MNINLPVLIGSWGFLAAIVVGLAIYRKVIASREDDTLHIDDYEAVLVPQQVAIARRLENVDRWGKRLTVVAFVYGLAVAAAYLYSIWQEGLKNIAG
jgi:hypothetical protein